jgi:type VI secretion system protein ImpK
MRTAYYEDSDRASYDARAAGSKNLLNLCAESFLLVLHIQAGNDPGHPEDLRKSISLLFQDLERRAKRQNQSEEDIKATRYALCALIDETILNSRWAFKGEWKDQPLQLEYFGEPLAGVRFFDLLGRVRKKGHDKVDLLEVFCMCLVLGLQGKYKNERQEELAEATRALVEEVNTLRGGHSGLAPHWKLPEEPVEAPPKTIPRWAWITGVASIFVVILVYIIFKLWLDSATAETIRQTML